MSKDRRWPHSWCAIFAAALIICAGAGSRQAAAAEPAVEPLTRFPQSLLSIRTAAGTLHHFTVWVADREPRREQGLMFVQKLDEHQGMLFIFPHVQPVAFWMKNTYIPLDMIFIDADGRIAGVIANATPLSLEPMPGPRPVKAVLELAAGTAERLSIRADDRVVHMTFKTKKRR
jgi:uncharacterized protein